MRLVFLALFFLSFHLSFGQDRTVNLKAIGTGASYEEAKTNTLRNAVEDAAGAFLVSTTSIDAVTDDLITDEIVKLSSGVVKHFKELSKIEDAGFWTVTMDVEVSLAEVVNYSKRNNVSGELSFDGNLMYHNMKLLQFQEDNEVKIVSEICNRIDLYFRDAFDFSLVNTQPTLDYAAAEVNWPLKVEVWTNSNYEKLARYAITHLEQVSVQDPSPNQLTIKQKLFWFYLKYKGTSYKFHFRSEKSLVKLQSLFGSMNEYLLLWDIPEISTMEKGDRISYYSSALLFPNHAHHFLYKYDPDPELWMANHLYSLSRPQGPRKKQLPRKNKDGRFFKFPIPKAEGVFQKVKVGEFTWTVYMPIDKAKDFEGLTLVKLGKYSEHDKILAALYLRAISNTGSDTKLRDIKVLEYDDSIHYQDTYSKMNLYSADKKNNSFKNFKTRCCKFKSDYNICFKSYVTNDGYLEIKMKERFTELDTLFESEHRYLFSKNGSQLLFYKDLGVTITKSFLNSQKGNKSSTRSRKELYKINDPDGWSNLRKTPRGEVLKKVYESEKFEVLGEEGKYKKVKLSDGTVGFIHFTRVVPVE
jgi:hypothetical protein